MAMTMAMAMAIVKQLILLLLSTVVVMVDRVHGGHGQVGIIMVLNFIENINNNIHYNTICERRNSHPSSSKYNVHILLFVMEQTVMVVMVVTIRVILLQHTSCVVRIRYRRGVYGE